MLHTLFCTLFLTPSHTLWRGVESYGVWPPPFKVAHGHMHI